MPVLFEDNFSSFNPTNWFTYTTGYCYGRTFFGCGGQPQIVAETGGKFLRLRVGNQNPDTCLGEYRPFQGTEIMTNDLFGVPADGSALEFEARIRCTTIASGVVFGFFPYIDTQDPDYLRDEIDFEFIGKSPFPYNTVWLNTWNNDQQKNSVTTVDDLNFSHWNVYKIRWAKGRIDWLINNNAVRTETNSYYIPDRPLKLHLNAWVPDAIFDVAYDAALPTSQPMSWYCDVDYVSVTSVDL